MARRIVPPRYLPEVRLRKFEEARGHSNRYFICTKHKGVIEFYDFSGAGGIPLIMRVYSDKNGDLRSVGLYYRGNTPMKNADLARARAERVKNAPAPTRRAIVFDNQVLVGTRRAIVFDNQKYRNTLDIKSMRAGRSIMEDLEKRKD